jgi:hypothetical protein
MRNGVDWRQYRERLAAIVAALEKDSEEEYAQFESAVADEAGPDVRVWPNFKVLYTVMNGFRLQWQYLGPEPLATTTGSAQIARLDDIYLPEGASAHVLGRIYDAARVFDLVGPDDHVGIQLHRDHQNPQLFYFADATRKYHQLSLTLDTYLATILEARAMYRWQHFFVSDPDFPLTKETAETFRHDLHFLFPDADVSLFKAPQEK